MVEIEDEEAMVVEILAVYADAGSSRPIHVVGVGVIDAHVDAVTCLAYADEAVRRCYRFVDILNKAVRRITGLKGNLSARDDFWGNTGMSHGEEIELVEPVLRRIIVD